MPTPQPKHKLSPSADGKAYILIGPYDERLIEALKRKVPASCREWKSVARCWRISLEYGEIVRKLVVELAEADAEEREYRGLREGTGAP